MTTMSDSKTRFCAKESFERGENFLGTMTTVKCYLLIEYDGAWSSVVNRLLENSKIEDRVVQYLNKFIQWCPEDVKVLFIKNKINTNNGKKIYLTRELMGKAQAREFNVDTYIDILKIDLKAAYKEPSECKNILVVCTHGKRDKCCAKFGFPIFLNLYDWINTSGKNFEIWECTHVGGDRFAANIIWLPYGLGFGHMQLQDGIFTKKLAQNKVALKYFRGCSFFPSAGQFLEGYVRKKYSLEVPGGIELVNYSESQVDEENILTNIEMRFVELEHKSISGVVNICRDTKHGKVLASCNNDGYALPRIIELVGELKYI